jgi:hypothetical protein
MMKHPLRENLNAKDWERIQTALDQDHYMLLTADEIDAAYDVFYDAMVMKSQTHAGVRTEQ